MCAVPQSLQLSEKNSGLAAQYCIHAFSGSVLHSK